jgi:imidazolonepropionase-like amidohydrolase
MRQDHRDRDGFRAPAAVIESVDLKNRTLLPGFFDMHVHLTSEYSKTREIDNYKLNEGERRHRGRGVRRSHLVSRLHHGARSWRRIPRSSRAQRDQRRQVPGPRIIAAGKAIGTTGGHADPTNGWAPQFPPIRARTRRVNSVDDARKAVRPALQGRLDTIKITATGGVLSIAKNGSTRSSPRRRSAQVVAHARDYGFKVAAHAHGAEGIKRASRRVSTPSNTARSWTTRPSSS